LEWAKPRITVEVAIKGLMNAIVRHGSRPQSKGYRLCSAAMPLELGFSERLQRDQHHAE
jgi:hypothetical protein